VNLPKNKVRHLLDNAKRLQKLLVYNAAIMPIGMLKFCLEYAESAADKTSGVFASIRDKFHFLKDTGLLSLLSEVYDLRNKYVAHQDEDLTDIEQTRQALKRWIALTMQLHEVAASVMPQKSKT